MAGFGVASVVTNIAGMAIGQAVQNRKANSNENVEVRIDNLQNDIDKKLKELGSTEDGYAKVNVASSFTNAVTNATGEVIRLEGEIKKLQEPTSGCEDYNSKLVDYNEQKAKLEALKDDAQKKLDAANDAKSAEEKRIANLKSEIKALIEQRDSQIAILNDKILDKADGHSYQRMSKEDFEGLFTTNGTSITSLLSGKTGNKKSIRYAILGFRNAQNNNDRTAYAQKFKLLYDTLGEEDKKDKNISAAYGIMAPYMN